VLDEVGDPSVGEGLVRASDTYDEGDDEAFPEISPVDGYAARVRFARRDD
jgi:hypothetical protein